MKNLVLAIVSLAIFSCKREDFNIINLNNNKISVLGHGGMGSGNIYPMNSYESILKCLSEGADGSEIDVQMTKDSVLVAFHDVDLSEDTDYEGLIHSFTWNELKDAQYIQTPYGKYALISLNDLFSNLEQPENYQFTFDCKLYPNSNDLESYYESFTKALITIISKYNLEQKVLIESQSPEFLNLIKNKNSSCKLFIYPSDFESGFSDAIELDLYGITISNDKISKEQVKTAHDNDLRIALWSVHSANENISAINKNPDFIQTDKVKHLVDVLNDQ